MEWRGLGKSILFCMNGQSMRICAMGEWCNVSTGTNFLILFRAYLDIEVQIVLHTDDRSLVPGLGESATPAYCISHPEVNG